MKIKKNLVAATAAVVLSVRTGDAALDTCPPALAANGVRCQP